MKIYLIINLLFDLIHMQEIDINHLQIVHGHLIAKKLFDQQEIYQKKSKKEYLIHMFRNGHKCKGCPEFIDPNKSNEIIEIFTSDDYYEYIYE